VRQTSGHPILINGLIFGVLVLLVSLISDGLSLIGVRLTEPAIALILSGVILLVELALFFLAGRAASARTGTVGAGALAGLLAAAIAGVGGAIITVVRVALDPAAIRDAALQSNPAVNPSALTDQIIIVTGVVTALVGLLFILGVGAGAGALGGRLGRQKYQPASYQESMYQGLPPQQPMG
jgi:hypothetical protein